MNFCWGIFKWYWWWFEYGTWSSKLNKIQRNETKQKETKRTWVPEKQVVLLETSATSPDIASVCQKWLVWRNFLQRAFLSVLYLTRPLVVSAAFFSSYLARALEFANLATWGQSRGGSYSNLCQRTKKRFSTSNERATRQVQYLRNDNNVTVCKSRPLVSFQFNASFFLPSSLNPLVSPANHQAVLKHVERRPLRHLTHCFMDFLRVATVITIKRRRQMLGRNFLAQTPSRTQVGSLKLSCWLCGLWRTSTTAAEWHSVSISIDWSH